MAKLNIVSYPTHNIAVVKQGGKLMRVKIPVNSEHPPVGDGEIKDKWERRELTKEEAAAITAPVEAPKELPKDQLKVK